MRAYQFADCVLNPERRELVYDDQPRHLEPQVFDLLLLLVQAGGRVVTKDEIIDRIWQGRAISDDALTSRIKKVRQAVGDDGRRQSIIRTHPRVGYQFAGTVSGFDPNARGQAVDADAPQTIQLAADMAPQHAPSLPSLPARLDEAAGRSVDRTPSLVVTPFIELGSSVGEAFVDGLVEEITVALSRASDFVVIARQSAYLYQGRFVDAREVGRDLGARYVVEGTVRRCGDRARISVRLVDAASGVQIWSERYDEPADDPVILQDRIAERVAGAVASSIRSSEIATAKSRPAEEQTAYDTTLCGLPHFWRHTRVANQTALACFDRAMERNPDYALAHAMRAWCLGQQVAHYWADDPDDRDDLAELAEVAQAAATRAVAIGGDRASALVAASAAFALTEPSPDRASDLIDGALRIDPNCAWAWMRKGWLYVHQLQAEQAIAAFNKAATLSPFDPFQFNIQFGKSYALGLLGDIAGAVALAERALRACPEISWPLLPLSAFYRMLGDQEKARRAMKRFRIDNPRVTVRTVLNRPAPPTFIERIDTFVEQMIEAGLPRD